MNPTDSETPRTIVEWVRRHRLRRRAQSGSEKAFRQHMRWLFPASGFVRYKGWKLAELEAALEEASGEDVREPDPSAVTRAGNSGVDVSGSHQNDRASVSAPTQSSASQRRCVDCGEVLASDRRRAGRCQRCRKRRANETAKVRMRRHRQRNASQHGVEHNHGRRSDAPQGSQTDDPGAGRVSVPPLLRS